MMRISVVWGYVLVAIVLAGCASNRPSAPISEGNVYTPAPTPATREPVYVVQKGDTLYSIALNKGVDYRELAAYNNIQDTGKIQVGQELRLPPTGAATATPINLGEPVRSEEIKSATGSVASSALTQPLTAKLPYSESAVAKIEKMQTVPQTVAAAPQPAAVPTPPTSVATGGDELDWGVPTQGKLVGGFSENASRKGIDIAGKAGQPVLASAAGKVVYVGNGLRGYGNLVIIKHNATYLSAYAHNSKILVKEGDTVTKGQKIAEMGDTDADQVKLHFEIRKQGNPVDPQKYLPKL